MKTQESNGGNSNECYYDFEVLSSNNIYIGNEATNQSPEVQRQIEELNKDSSKEIIKVLSRQLVDVFDIDYRTKFIMDEAEQELNEELVDGESSKFVEMTMGSKPLVHKIRVEFLTKHYMSFKTLSEKLNSTVKIIVSVRCITCLALKSEEHIHR